MIAKATAAYQFLEPMLADPQFLADPGRARALTNFVRFTRAEHWMGLHGEPHALGMDIPDKDYWAYAAPYVGFPELLRSQTFLRDMSKPATYQAAVDMIEEHNSGLPGDQKWIVFPFKAQFIKSVDQTTYGRLLVLVPNVVMPDGKVLDRWILFAVATPDLNPVPGVRSVSVIGDLRDPTVPGVSKVFFSDYMRQTDASSGRIAPYPNFLMDSNPSKNCYECHKTGVLPIKPEIAYKFDANGTLVPDSGALDAMPDRLNSLIASYGRSDLGHMDTDAYGPSLGSVGRDRSDDFIASATDDRPVSTSCYDKIRADMNCSKCHDSFAKINYLLAVKTDGDVKSYEAKQGLVQTSIEKGYMPPGNNLTVTERHALWECVSKEYLDLDRTRGVFVDWLRGSSP